MNGHRALTFDPPTPQFTEQQDQYARIKEKGASKSRRSIESIESLPNDPYSIINRNDIEDVQIPSSLDANHSVEIHRTKGVTKVYKAILDGQDSDTSVNADNHTNQNRENSNLTNQRQAYIPPAGLVANSSSLHRKVSHSRSEPEFPVYSVVNKETKAHSSSEMRDSNYIDSSELFPVYEAIGALDVAVEEADRYSRTRYV